MTETRIKLYTRNPEHSTFDNDQMQKKKKKNGADHLKLILDCF